MAEKQAKTYEFGAGGTNADESATKATTAAPDETASARIVVPDVALGDVSATTTERTSGERPSPKSTAGGGVLRPEERKPRYVWMRALITEEKS